MPIARKGPPSQFSILWIDSGREPVCSADPAFPNGRDLVATTDLSRDTCIAALPYPAKRCGHYLITCKTCNMRALASTAGRADDPRSMALPCQQRRRQ